MQINTSDAMTKFGQILAQKLTLPAVIELKGDVGVGKTTFTQGLAAGLGVTEPVTSPSFTISKRYAFPGGELVHYDFYRLGDVGIMADELSETLIQPQTVTVIEWGQDVAALLPQEAISLEFTLQPDGSRQVSTSSSPARDAFHAAFPHAGGSRHG